jgi:hypothetical protein
MKKLRTVQSTNATRNIGPDSSFTPTPAKRCAPLIPIPGSFGLRGDFHQRDMGTEEQSFVSSCQVINKVWSTSAHFTIAIRKAFVVRLKSKSSAVCTKT